MSKCLRSRRRGHAMEADCEQQVRLITGASNHAVVMLWTRRRGIRARRLRAEHHDWIAMRACRHCHFAAARARADLRCLQARVAVQSRFSEQSTGCCEPVSLPAIQTSPSRCNCARRGFGRQSEPAAQTRASLLSRIPQVLRKAAFSIQIVVPSFG